MAATASPGARGALSTPTGEGYGGSAPGFRVLTTGRSFSPCVTRQAIPILWPLASQVPAKPSFHLLGMSWRLPFLLLVLRAYTLSIREARPSGWLSGRPSYSLMRRRIRSKDAYPSRVYGPNVSDDVWGHWMISFGRSPGTLARDVDW